VRPKFCVWSDCRAPAQKQWMFASKRDTRSSIGPKVLLAAVVAVAGVIGIRGIDPQVIDAGWVQDSPAHLPKISLSTATTKRSGIVAAIPLPPRRALTAGEATVFSRRPDPELSQPHTTVAAVEPLAEAATPLVLAEIPDAQAKADTQPPQPAPGGAAKSADKSRAVLVVRKAMVVQKKTVQVEHRQRSHSGAYVQNGGWSWPSGGWMGYSPFGNSRSF
jgi:hypothetical protein